MNQPTLRHFDQWSFIASVICGIVGAFAGGLGYQIPAIVAGCLAAVFPIMGRYSSQRLNRMEMAAANDRANAAELELQNLRQRLQPRRLATQQINIIAQVLRQGPPFKVGVNHNRHEIEQNTYSEDIRNALTQGGVEAGYFGGATNATHGTEISGPESIEKHILMAALSAANVKFLPIVLTDDPKGVRGIEIWVGVHPGIV